jgi:hypothetical protein
MALRPFALILGLPVTEHHAANNCHPRMPMLVRQKRPKRVISNSVIFNHRKKLFSHLCIQLVMFIRVGYQNNLRGTFPFQGLREQ